MSGKKILITVCILLSSIGCGGEATSDMAEDAQRSDSEVGSVTQAWMADGYIRERGSPRIFRLYGGSICWVYDPGQLDALQGTSPAGFDGSSQPTWQMLQENRTYQGSCRYPAGAMLKVNGNRDIYRIINATSHCRVRDPAQLARFGGRYLTLYRPPSQVDFKETFAVDAYDRPRTPSGFIGTCSDALAP